MCFWSCLSFVCAAQLYAHAVAVATLQNRNLLSAPASLVDWLTRWYLWYRFLDFYVDHLYFVHLSQLQFSMPHLADQCSVRIIHWNVFLKVFDRICFPLRSCLQLQCLFTSLQCQIVGLGIHRCSHLNICRSALQYPYIVCNGFSQTPNSNATQLQCNIFRNCSFSILQTTFRPGSSNAGGARIAQIAAISAEWPS